MGQLVLHSCGAAGRRRKSVLREIFYAFIRSSGLFRTKKARGLSRAFRRSQEPCWCLKVSSVLPSPLVGGVFLDRLFLSAAEGPFFDTFFGTFFVWFGSHRSINYNNVSEISAIIFYERTRPRSRCWCGLGFALIRSLSRRRPCEGGSIRGSPVRLVVYLKLPEIF